MPQIAINQDGTVAVTLTQREQSLARMILEERGADVFSEVFTLWFTNASREVVDGRVERLTPADRADLFTKMEAARPSPHRQEIPVSTP